MRTIIPEVMWVGNARDAREIKGVLDVGVCAVVDLAIEEPPIAYLREMTYCRFPLFDGEGNSAVLLRAAIEVTANFIANAVPTLVACSNGMSRSPAIAAAVLARRESVDRNAALKRVAEGAPCDVAPGLWQEILACE